ncbi:MAG: toll/interleukin-1 receptor domain-containing protein [Clostridia bacterium]|nr:toll/interleukin-1 receptor domain-containing protein [Clostridia bacterium]
MFNMFNIFISYSSKDQKIADEIYRVATTKYDQTCWLAPSETGIKPGEYYPEEIINGIQNSQIVLFIESSHSIKSKYVYRELERSVHFEKIIIRYTIEKCDDITQTGKKIIDFFTCVEQSIDAVNDPFKCIDSLCLNMNSLLGKKSTISLKQEKLKKDIIRYINSRTLTDQNWVSAISSQYFLIEIAFMLGLTDREDYYNLEEEFYAHSCKLARGGRILPDPNQILVVPEENEKLIANMRDEDDNGVYYSERLRAKYIDSQQKKDLIFYNYYYGLMVGIINRLCQNNPNNDIYNAIRVATVEELFKTEACDTAGGGLYHYRLPWITARALISLARYSNDDIRNVLRYYPKFGNLTYVERNDFFDIKSRWLQSVVDRLESSGYWKSGAGSWVSQWEATGLCLESILVNNATGEYITEIRQIFSHIFAKENISHWLSIANFSCEYDSNQTLASIILASVSFRIIKKGIVEGYKSEYVRILSYFEDCLEALFESEQDNVQQQCTIPQCLYYILVAIKEE